MGNHWTGRNGGDWSIGMITANRIAFREDFLTLSLVKGQERYIFLVDDTPVRIGEALRTMGRFASDPDLSFSWYDAAMLSQKLRGMKK